MPTAGLVSECTDFAKECAAERQPGGASLSREACLLRVGGKREGTELALDACAFLWCSVDDTLLALQAR